LTQVITAAAAAVAAAPRAQAFTPMQGARWHLPVADSSITTSVWLNNRRILAGDDEHNI
jgi:hypothetical protein